MDNNQELILKENESRDKSHYWNPNFLSSIDLQSRYSTVWHRSEDPSMDNLPFGQLRLWEERMLELQRNEMVIKKISYL